MAYSLRAKAGERRGQLCRSVILPDKVSRSTSANADYRSLRIPCRNSPRSVAVPILHFREQGALHPRKPGRLGRGKTHCVSQIDERGCVMAISPTQPATTVTAESIAKALGGRKTGGGWMARCPAHHDRQPSLSIREQRTARF